MKRWLIMWLFWALIALSIFLLYRLFVSLKKLNANKNALMLQYLGGYPNVKGPKAVAIRHSADDLLFEGISIPKANITDIKLVPRSVIGSAAAGAALGAAVAGPLGALIGGAAAAGSQGAGNVINLTYSKAGINYELFFADPDIINKYSRLQMMIK